VYIPQIGQFPETGGGFCDFNFFLNTERCFVHVLHVFFLPALFVEKKGKSSINLGTLQLRHGFKELIIYNEGGRLFF
jgi:hypothetical protein